MIADIWGNDYSTTPLSKRQEIFWDAFREIIFHRHASGYKDGLDCLVKVAQALELPYADNAPWAARK